METDKFHEKNEELHLAFAFVIQKNYRTIDSLTEAGQAEENHTVSRAMMHAANDLMVTTRDREDMLRRHIEWLNTTYPDDHYRTLEELYLALEKPEEENKGS